MDIMVLCTLEMEEEVIAVVEGLGHTPHAYDTVPKAIANLPRATPNAIYVQDEISKLRNLDKLIEKAQEFHAKVRIFDSAAKLGSRIGTA